MDCGKLTESVYERSVVRVVKANSTENRKFYDGAGLGADCAVLPGQGTSVMISGQALAAGADAGVAARAYAAAINHAAACCADRAAAGLSGGYALMTLMVPGKLREIKVRGIMQAVSALADETGIPLLGCNVQALTDIGEPAAVCVVNAAAENRNKNNIVAAKEKVRQDEDIVMTKWAGLEGTAVIANESAGRLSARYPKDIVQTAAGFYQYLSVIAEAAAAVKSGAGHLLVPREGGIFGGLWRLVAENGVGLVADLKRIPVRQETIEVCEFFDLNPYELLAGGSLLITTANGGALVRALEAAGIPAAVIGHTTQGNDRIICHNGEERFLEPAKGDAIFQYKKSNGGWL